MVNWNWLLIYHSCFKFDSSLNSYGFSVLSLTCAASRLGPGCRELIDLNNLLSTWKPSFELSMSFLTSNFSPESLLNFWLINLTIRLDLPNQWQSSISDLEILIFYCEKILMIFSSDWSSFTFAGMPCILKCSSWYVFLLIWSLLQFINQII